MAGARAHPLGTHAHQPAARGRWRLLPHSLGGHGRDGAGAQRIGALPSRGHLPRLRHMGGGGRLPRRVRRRVRASRSRPASLCRERLRVSAASDVVGRERRTGCTAAEHAVTALAVASRDGRELCQGGSAVEHERHRWRERRWRRRDGDPRASLIHEFLRPSRLLCLLCVRQLLARR